MLSVCRAEDGQVFQTEATWQEIGNLEHFLQEVTQSSAESILAYLSDGRRLTNENLVELGGIQDQTIFTFNKTYLDYDLDQLLPSLQVDPQLQPPIEEDMSATPPFRPSQLATSYLRTAHTHWSHIQQIIMSLANQREALVVALRSLDMHILNILDTFDTLSGLSSKELTRQASLLGGIETDLELIGRVRIHREFFSMERKRAIESGEEKERTLADYVSNIKMRQVAETCRKTHEELRARFTEMEMAVKRLQEGAEVIRASVEDTGLLNDADAYYGRAQSVFEKLSDLADSLQSPNPTSDTDTSLRDLKQLDTSLRETLLSVVSSKNAYTSHVLVTLRNIGLLNNELLRIPPGLAALNASFRGSGEGGGKKGGTMSFSHIERLHGMIYAYGATVVEIVRRKEFSRFFYQRAQSILDVMAKLSSSERKRRQIYRSEIQGQLPFEVKWMSEEYDPVPSVDLKFFGRRADGDGDEGEYGYGYEEGYRLERGDIDGLFRLLDDLESLGRTSNDASVLSAVVECRTGLEKQVAKMDGLEAGFDKIAERSLLSSSRISHSRRRSIEQDEHLLQELIDQLRSVQDSKSHLESQFQAERLGLKSEIHRLQTLSKSFETDVNTERDRADRLDRELAQIKARLDVEGTGKRTLEERYHELVRELERQRVEKERALHDATEQTRAAEMLKAELAQVKSDFEDVKALESRNSARMASLLEEQANNLRILEEARARGEDLEEQIQRARAESEEVKGALKGASEDKDRLLKMQASEHERIMRDHIAEADGDRAVLERQFWEVKAVLEREQGVASDLKNDLQTKNAEMEGVKVELMRTKKELEEARHVERVLRDDLRAGKSSQEEYEQKVEDKERLVAQILDVALAFRASHVKALGTAQAIASHPRQHQQQSASLAESAFGPLSRHSVIGGLQVDEPAPIEIIDPSDPSSALESLRLFDHDHFNEAIAKTGGVVRKWQKQCKEYRERAKGKISFRNFQKGDLALFLPTRNSVSKPWAAFNVSFPHYFLQATGHLAEQLKSREWIVARITSITERVVDRNDPNSNPYGLGDGVKYYMLEVEDWTQPNSHNSNKRRVSSRKQGNGGNDGAGIGTGETLKLSTSPSAMGDSTPMLPPPEPEVEDTFQVAAQSPSSHLFVPRARATSSSPSTSATARPSSLSRLLAQASSEMPPETPEDAAAPLSPKSPPEVVESPKEDKDREKEDQEAQSKTEFPTTSPPPPPSPSLPSGSVPRQVGAGPLNPQSPLRPGSRASRQSTTSRFSVSGGSRLPLGTATSGSPVKAVATTALSSDRIASPTSYGPETTDTNTPSPEGSISEGITNLLKNTTSSNSNSRRRTASYHIARGSPLAVSEGSGPSTTSSSNTVKPSTSGPFSFASWGFGRRKKPEMSNLAPTLETSSAGGENSRPSDSSTASEMLRRF